MRYKLDPILSRNFQLLKDAFNKVHRAPQDSEEQKRLVDTLLQLYEIGFDDGCQSSAIYSERLTELYAPVELSDESAAALDDVAKGVDE